MFTGAGGGYLIRPDEPGRLPGETSPFKGMSAEAIIHTPPGAANPGTFPS